MQGQTFRLFLTKWNKQAEKLSHQNFQFLQVLLQSLLTQKETKLDFTLNNKITLIIKKNIDNYIVRSEQKDWTPLVEDNFHYKGLFVKSLRFDEEKQRSTTILLKFESGASYPYYNHPAKL